MNTNHYTFQHQTNFKLNSEQTLPRNIRYQKFHKPNFEHRISDDLRPKYETLCIICEQQRWGEIYTDWPNFGTKCLGVVGIIRDKP